MDEHKDINDNNQVQQGGDTEHVHESEDVINQQKEDVFSATKNSDKTSGGRRWGTAAGSFLIGALLMFAFMYFWLGAQNDVVAVVNGDEISQEEFIEFAISGGGAQLLDQIILEKIIQQKADQEGITISDKELETKFNEFKDQVPSKDLFEEFLTQQGLTEESFREQMRTNLLLEKMVKAEIEVSDEEVREYFDGNKEQFGEPEQVKAKQIIAETEEEAKKAHKRLQDGEDFTEVAKDVSIDPETKDNGGDLGNVPKGRLARIDPDLEEKVFSLAEGELSEPIESQSGFYIVHVDKKIAAKEAEFDEKTIEEITEILIQQKLQVKMPEWIGELRESADIDNKLQLEEDAVEVTKG